mmetsp:Transcript_11461/g.20661  ORF Transcript_11461/g.20661 Transcript_11461/m.20661 type:complete len:213 (-) Transcript_11461:155-793(-)
MRPGISASSKATWNVLFCPPRVLSSSGAAAILISHFLRAAEDATCAGVLPLRFLTSPDAPESLTSSLHMAMAALASGTRAAWKRQVSPLLSTALTSPRISLSALKSSRLHVSAIGKRQVLPELSLMPTLQPLSASSSAAATDRTPKRALLPWASLSCESALPSSSARNVRSAPNVLAAKKSAVSPSSASWTFGDAPARSKTSAQAGSSRCAA